MKNKAVLRAAVVTVVFSMVFTGCNSMSRAAYKGDLEKVKKLVRKGADVNDYDRWGWTPLHWAVYYNYYPTVKYLLEHNADPNIGTVKKYGYFYKGTTPLMIAAYYNFAASAKLLLQRGARVGTTDRKGIIAQDYAEQNGCTEVIKLLNQADDVSTNIIEDSE